MDYIFESIADSHRKSVTDIFNYFIKNSYAAYLEEEVDYTFFGRFMEMSRGYPAIVIKLEESCQVIGFAFMRPYHFAASFKRTAEVTYYILPEHGRRGLGTAVLNLFIEKAGQRGIDSILASTSSQNTESIQFHLKNGFRECGRFLKVGRKFGKDFDAVWMQRQLS